MGRVHLRFPLRHEFTEDPRVVSRDLDGFGRLSLHGHGDAARDIPDLHAEIPVVLAQFGKGGVPLTNAHARIESLLHLGDVRLEKFRHLGIPGGGRGTITGLREFDFAIDFFVIAEQCVNRVPEIIRHSPTVTVAFALGLGKN